MSTHEPSSRSGSNFREVAVRFADSYEGFSEAMDLTKREDLAEAFREIADRRKLTGDQISGVIEKRGLEPSTDGSVEGAAHRWWIRLRDKLSDDEMKAVLEECIRGEKVLAGSIEDCLKKSDLNPEETALLHRALEEVRETITHFESAIG